MTRTAVYSAALVALVAASVMTLTSIASPNWVSYAARAPSGGTVTDAIGLHRRCTSPAPSAGSGPGKTCTPFPEASRCEDGPAGRSFCTMWRTTGFLMSFAVVVELATLVAFVIVMAGGKARRQAGWKVPVVMLAIVAAAEAVGSAVVAYLFDHDDLFLVPDYRLGSSWYLSAFSAGALFLAAAGLAISAFVLPPENGYQLVEDPSGV